jgi:hypothetical protein
VLVFIFSFVCCLIRLTRCLICLWLVLLSFYLGASCYRCLLVIQFVLGFLFALVCSLGLHLVRASLCVVFFFLLVFCESLPAV